MQIINSRDITEISDACGKTVCRLRSRVVIIAAGVTTRSAAGEMLPPLKDCVQSHVEILPCLPGVERVAHTIAKEVERK